MAVNEPYEPTDPPPASPLVPSASTPESRPGNTDTIRLALRTLVLILLIGALLTMFMLLVDQMDRTEVNSGLVAILSGAVGALTAGIGLGVKDFFRADKE